MTEDESTPTDADCSNCGESIPATASYCTACGAEQTTSAEAEPGPASSGVTNWAIGFAPGATLRNVLVAAAYVVFYVVGIPLLLYAYWARGGKYRKRTYYALGALGIGFVALVVLLAVIGAMVGPATETGTSPGGEQAVESTPTPEPAPAFSVRIHYGGSWQGALSVTGGGSSTSESISGSGSRSIPLSGAVDIVSVNAQKQDDSSAEIVVQILRRGEVVAEASTTSGYGVAQTSQAF
jgi:hypothetical protein